jgi:hypothetical protein
MLNSTRSVYSLMVVITLIGLFPLATNVSQSSAQSSTSPPPSNLDLYQIYHTLYTQSGCSGIYSSSTLQYCVSHTGGNATVTASVPSTNKVLLSGLVLSQLSNGSILATLHSKNLVVNPGEYPLGASAGPQKFYVKGTYNFSCNINCNSGVFEQYNYCGDGPWTTYTTIGPGYYGTIYWDGPDQAYWGPPPLFCDSVVATYTGASWSITDHYTFSASGNANYLTWSAGFGPDYDYGSGVALTYYVNLTLTYTV